MKLTSDIFIVRSGAILLLERRGSSRGFWYIPGGFVEPGEDPAAAAVREVHEETGLKVVDPEILRVWCYQLPDAKFAYHVTYAGFSDEGSVVVSGEHTGFKWMDPRDYRDVYLPSAIDRNDSVQASFYSQLRRNLDLLLEKLAVKKDS